MKLKKIVTLISSAILAFSLVGCSIEGEESSAGSDGAVVGNGSIGFSVSTLNNPFFVTLSQGAKDKAKEEGRDLIVVDAGDDAAKQTSDIEDLISKDRNQNFVPVIDDHNTFIGIIKRKEIIEYCYNKIHKTVKT